MKMLLGLGFAAMMAGGCFGQHRGGHGFVSTGHSFEHGQFPGGFVGGFPRGFFFTPQQIAVNLGIPPISPIPFLGVNSLGVDVLVPGLGITRHFGSSLFSGLFSGFGGYPLLPVIGDGYGSYGGGANIIVLQPIQMPFQPPPRPEIAKPQLHEYKEPPGTTPATGEQPVFSLQLKGGSTQPAVLVWVSSGMVHYLDRQNKGHAVALDAVDREATLRVNREKNLELHLPLEE